MQQARDQFLAGTRFAGDHYRCMRLGKTPDGAEDFLHRRGLPQNLGVSSIFSSAPTWCIDWSRPAGSVPAPDRRRTASGRYSKAPPWKAATADSEIGIGGHDDDRQGREALLHLLQQLQPGLAGHADIREQHLRASPPRSSTPGLGGGGKLLNGNLLAGRVFFASSTQRMERSSSTIQTGFMVLSFRGRGDHAPPVASFMPAAAGAPRKPFVPAGSRTRSCRDGAGRSSGQSSDRGRSRLRGRKRADRTCVRGCPAECPGRRR